MIEIKRLEIRVQIERVRRKVRSDLTITPHSSQKSRLFSF